MMTKMIVLAACFGVTARASAECAPIANADRILTAGARIHVGEMHGTVEIPRWFGELVCHATKLPGAVRVALEVPAEEDAAIAVYLKSAGAPADRAALLRGAFWTDKFQDGRRSQAMLELIDRVRKLRKDGADVDIATFDIQVKNRDRAMAERLLAAVNKLPKATWLALSGNIHARKSRGQMPYTLMAGELVTFGAPFLTLDARYGAGSAWVCLMDGECGPHGWGRGSARPVAVALEPSKDGAYDGRLDVGTIHFSPPAAVPLTDRQKLLATIVDKQIEASATYDAKKYDRCAALYVEIARTLHSADDAYSAACCFALAGQVDQSFAQLSSAVELGFSDAANLSKDSDLVALRTDARWQPLVTRVVASSSAKK
jgi:hypothetical protein